MKVWELIAKLSAYPAGYDVLGAQGHYESADVDMSGPFSGDDESYITIHFEDASIIEEPEA